MPLGKNATAGDYVKDFRKSKAPQFKGKSKDKRHQMAIAAYLDKRDNQKEAKFAGNNLKLFSQLNRNGTKPELDRNIPELSMKLKAKAKIARGLRGPSTKAKPDMFRTTGKRAKEIERKAKIITTTAKRDDTKKQIIRRAMGVKEGSYKVSIAGLPDLYMDDKTPGQLLQKLRKIIKQPSMITDVERTTTAKKRKVFRDKSQGREEIKSEYKYDYGSPESVRLMKKITPGENVKEGIRGSTDAPKGPESYQAQYKRRLVKTTDPEHTEKGYKYRIKGKKNSALTKKLYKSKPDQGEFNKQMKRIAGHEFG